MKEKPKQKNQHFVPVTYFKLFSKDGKNICLLLRNNGETKKPASIKDQASKDYFYGDEDVKEFNTVFQKIRENVDFEKYTLEDCESLLKNIMFQKTRTMSARQKNKPVRDGSGQVLLKHMLHQFPIDKNKKEAFFSEWKKADPKKWQKREMDDAIEAAKSLFHLSLIMLQNETDKPFIFGDAPVIFTNPFLRNITLEGVLGTQDLGLIIIYPVGDKNCIMLIDERVYKINGLQNDNLFITDLNDVSALNKLQIHNAVNTIYFSDFRYSSYIHELWQEEKNILIKNNQDEFINLLSELNNIEMFDITHSFEKQLPYIPNFSFLEYQELLEKDYKYNQPLIEPIILLPPIITHIDK